MTPVSGVTNNMWRRTQSGLYAPERRNFPIDSLALYLPLWHPELNGSTIVSKDLNAISCTVASGVTWGIQGRTFPAQNNKNIQISSASNLITGTNDFAITMWIYPTSGNCVGLIWGSTTSENVYMIYMNGTLQWLAAPTTLVDNIAGAITLSVWQMITLSKIGTLYAVYKNNTLIGSKTQTAVDLGTPTSNYFIGTNRIGTQSWGGTLGELIVWQRGRTQGQDAQTYLATKWRYQ